MDLLDALVQPYVWGSDSFIATLQQREPTGQPEAELWMGAHPKAPSRLRSDGRGLDAVIAEDPIGTLGASTFEAFGQLPFLAKVLAAAAPLSIQSHPSLAQAVAGFDRESAAGIPVDSPVRTYRDANHKPELICALTHFEAKCGFRSLDATREFFGALTDPALDPLRARLQQHGAADQVLADVLAWLLRVAPQEAADLSGAAARSAANIDDGPFALDAAWTTRLATLYPGDIGAVVALLLNHVVLEPGEAVFLGAGNLHAYLEGAGIELMANSDNVVRGGLTPKHIDVEELLHVVSCFPIEAPVQKCEGAIHTYASPVPEFALQRIDVAGHHEVAVAGPEILVASSGSLTITTSAGITLDARQGEPIWIPASDQGYAITSDCVVYRSTVGQLRS